MFLHLILIRLASEDIIKRELRLDALLLEVAREAHRHSVRVAVAVIELDVCFDAKAFGVSDDFELKLVLVIDEVRHVVMVAAPRIRHLFRLRCEHLGVLARIVRVQDIVELLNHLRTLNMMLVGALLDCINEVHLFLNVLIFLRMLRLECFLENIEAVKHGEPLEASHELIDDLAHLVAVADAAHVHFDIILANQALWIQLAILNVEAALAEISLSVRSVLGDCLVEEVFLLKAVSAIYRVLDIVLDFGEKEDSVLTCRVQRRRVHRVMSPALQHLVLEVLLRVLATLEEHCEVLLANCGP